MDANQPLATGDQSYGSGLVRMTRIGVKYTILFFSAFVFVYAVGEYPPLTVWINLVSLICSLVAALLAYRFGMFRAAAHLLTLAIFVSSAGVVAISGGIHSSSIVWQIFVPLAAFIMAGRWAGLIWGGISMVSVLGFYLLEQAGIVASITEFHTTPQDLVLDLTTSIICVSIAVWYSDSLKSRALSQLENTRAELSFFATTDPLTKILNRRHFFVKAEEAIQKAGNGNQILSFLLVDIDHFKTINDRHGHAVGDQILVGLVQLCLENLRSHDILGRFGGEEFLILLPESDLAAAGRIAERLLAKIEQSSIPTHAGPLRITVSIGISTMEQGQTVTADELFFQADQAMYRAKQEGRNRIRIWQKPVPAP